jgi:hypothetical protein
MIRNPMRQCGRQYADEAEALRSKAGQRPGIEVKGCRCGRFHITAPPAPREKNAPVMWNTELAHRITGSRTGISPAAGSHSGRPHSFPPAVAALLDARDPWCIYCGSPRDLQRHHRRLKGIGGDGRDHTQCACNGVRLCADHHAWAHSGIGQKEARDEGLIVPRSTLEPFRASVLVHLEADSGGLLKYPSCDGRWLDAAELELAS